MASRKESEEGNLRTHLKANEPMSHRSRTRNRSELPKRSIEVLSGNGRMQSADSKIVRVDERSIRGHFELSSLFGFVEAMAADDEVRRSE